MASVTDRASGAGWRAALPRHLSVLALALAALWAAALGAPATARAASPPAVEARAWAVVDATTGLRIGGVDDDLELPMASTTKIMTGLVVLRAVRDLGTPMTVPASVERIPLGRMGLKPGTRYTCEELLWATLVESANDAALTLAVNVAGSEPAFVRLMNAESRRLGLEGTRFRNPHGLDEEGHFSTARDLCELGRVAMADPRFARYVAHRTRPFTFAGTGKKVVLRSHNTFLDRYAWADGVKTGETQQARFCLVASGAPAGPRIVAALLGDTSRSQRTADAGALVEWAAGQYVPWVAPGVGSVVARVWGAGGRRDLPLALVHVDGGASLPAPAAPSTVVDRSPQLRLPLDPGSGLAFVTWRSGAAEVGRGVAWGSAGFVTAE
jgi:serine-type D-Ala-D-Ala carboxypeptidase (penicillin-binding protein 5/6)